MKKTLLTLLLFVGIIAVSACQKKDEKPAIVGKWAHGSYVYTFNEDKTCSYDASGSLMECTYTIDGDKLSVLYNGNTAPFETTYSIDGNKLNVKDSFGNDTIYEKK